jgi:hypothetical protein
LGFADTVGMPETLTADDVLGVSTGEQAADGGSEQSTSQDDDGKDEAE